LVLTQLHDQPKNHAVMAETQDTLSLWLLHALVGYLNSAVRYLPMPLGRGALTSSHQEYPMSLFDLSGRIAIVTGGNGGIGLGMAEGLASAGAVVGLAARNVDKGEGAVQRIARAGGRAEFAEVDVTSEASCRALIDKAAARHGRLDILVNNAGTNIRKSADQ